MSAYSQGDGVTLYSDGVAAIPAYSAVVTDASGDLGLPAGSTNGCIGFTGNQGVALGDTTTPISVISSGLAKATCGLAGITAVAGGVRHLMVEPATGRLVDFVAAAGNYHVADWIPNRDQTSAADGDRVLVRIVSNPLLT